MGLGMTKKRDGVDCPSHLLESSKSRNGGADKKALLKKYPGGQGHDPVVKSVHCSCKGLGLSSQHLNCLSFQLQGVNDLLGPSQAHCTHVHISTHRHMHIINKIKPF